jgi:hypothetical protein
VAAVVTEPLSPNPKMPPKKRDCGWEYCTVTCPRVLSQPTISVMPPFSATSPSTLDEA